MGALVVATRRAATEPNQQADKQQSAANHVQYEGDHETVLLIGDGAPPHRRDVCPSPPMLRERTHISDRRRAATSRSEDSVRRPRGQRTTTTVQSA